ncbi:hypothetical protein DFH08DRAFT_103031 [Mycena albidolilacea]|uniref:Uncharacterized protein n=1 Tax=Mycena albidolilacea TaxID=1033008 RepID=A0AAD7E6Y8_9AGAR|nr:hypothetical protein DFH08DRAFT_103031 [Mycena albidolilacea]
MANVTTLPNAFTPLAFLPPALAGQFEVSRYIFAATLGAYLWDIGLNLGNDYKLLFEHRVRFPTIVYFLSRIFTLSYIITPFVFQVSNVADCSALMVGVGVCNVLAQSATAMLFFLRVTAIWYPSKVAYVVFLLLWLGVTGAAVTVPAGIRGAHIATTMQCINTVVPDSTEATAIMGLINDSAVFLAINYRILGYTLVSESFKSIVVTFFGGGHLSRLSRALVQSGQHFYLVAVCGNIVILVLVKVPGVPPTYRGMLTIPSISLVNAMACLVFRKIKFGLITTDGTSFPKSKSGNTSTFHATANPRSHPVRFRSGDLSATDFESTPDYPLEIRIEREPSRKEGNTLVAENIKGSLQ